MADTQSPPQPEQDSRFRTILPFVLFVYFVVPPACFRMKNFPAPNSLANPFPHSLRGVLVSEICVREKQLRRPSTPLRPARRQHSLTAFCLLLTFALTHAAAAQVIEAPLPPAWSTSPDARLEIRDGQFLLIALGGDPFLHTRLLSPGRPPYVAELRLRSTSAGHGQFFWSTAPRDSFAPQASVTFPVEHDNLWHDYTVKIPATNAITALRWDPATAPGEIRLARLALRDADGKLTAEWRYAPGPAPTPLFGHSVTRAPAGVSEIVLTTTARLAGAIHSLTWNGMEFIDSVDHGRQLQSAASFDNSPTANAETFHPTEAGSRRDGAGPRSTSKLLELRSAGHELVTRTQMAYWLAPGERSAGQLARNTNTLSAHLLTKRVRLGHDRFSQMLDYQATFTVPVGETHRTAQFEALTGYLPAAFERFWQFNVTTKKLEPLTDGPGEIPRPVVLATASGSHAMGIYAPLQPRAGQTGPTYGRWRFGPEKVVKWNCVFRLRASDSLPAGDYTYQLLVPLGTLAEVEAMLVAVSAGEK